jgi:hypothetical protein
MTEQELEEATELTFPEQQRLTEILEQYRSNPSNSNKYRYHLFAEIDAIMTERVDTHIEAIRKELENKAVESLDCKIVEHGEQHTFKRTKIIPVKAVREVFNVKEGK